MGDAPGSDRAERRAARTGTSAALLRAEVCEWLGTRREDARFARFASHFDVLETVLVRMLDAIDRELGRLAPDRSSGAVYERCRELDRSLGTVHRTFTWYATKYDQRLDERLGPALRAADEVVRSCWTEPFVALRRRPPTGPLAYLDARFDAAATPRVSVPPDLRAPADAVVAEHVRALPVPTIALPELAWREPWWLVLAAHETGHHVLKDLQPALEADARAALAAAVGAELAADWSGWAGEVFADAYSVLMVGAGAAAAVDELQHATPRLLVSAPQAGDRYPPPAVRLGLLGELARRAGLDVSAGPPASADLLGWLAALPAEATGPAARAAVERHLRAVPAAAAALVDLPVGGSTLRRISGVRPLWFGAGGRVGSWARQLRGRRPLLAPLGARPAARLALAAGVACYQRPEPADDLALVGRNLLDVLPSCGEPGVLAPAPPATDVSALADRLADALVRPPGPREAPR